MGRLAAFCRSVVGKKVVLAATGLVLFLFLVGHLLGNLLIFVGREQLNAYAAFLKRTGELLWAARLILLAALILHILASLQITLVNWRVRPVDHSFLSPRSTRRSRGSPGSTTSCARRSPPRPWSRPRRRPPPCFAGATGIFFGYYPAQRASRLDPVEALGR